MSNKVHIEVMIDTNANSRKIDGQFKELRNGMHGDNNAAGSVSRTLQEFRSYLEGVQQMTGVEYEVSQRDTAQIFHEKTNTFTPELAAEAGIEIRPDFLRENLESGFYHVEPPIHGEELYYEALRKMVYMIQEDKEPGKLKSEGIEKPEDIGVSRLQGMYREHMMNLPQNSKYRQKPPFKAEFRRYHKIRFNQGEETAITFLRNHPLPAEGERTAFVFVGSDNYANESMATARNGQEDADRGKFEVFVTGPSQFQSMLEKVIRNIEAQHPQCRKLREGLQEFRHIEGDFVPTQHPHLSAGLLHEEGKSADLPAQRRPAAFQTVEDRQVGAFADFVTRVGASRQGADSQKGRG